MIADLERILFTEEEISRRVSELAKEVSAAYSGKRPLAVGVLKGSIPFFADLLRRMTVPVEEDFIAASSYGAEAVSSGKLLISKDLSCDVSGRDILLIEDVVDSGYTLSMLKSMLLERGASSVKIVTFLDKPECRKHALTPDFFGFQVGNEFVVGYGLDYNERYRQLPYIGVLKQEIYKR